MIDQDNVKSVYRADLETTGATNTHESELILQSRSVVLK